MTKLQRSLSIFRSLRSKSALLTIALVLAATSLNGLVSTKTEASCFFIFCSGPVVAGGFDTHILYQSDPDAYLTLAQNSGAGYIRDDITWASVEQSKGVYWWDQTDPVISYAAKHKLRVLMIVDEAPSWASGVPQTTDDWQWSPPINVADYANFAGQVAARYGSKGTFWTANPSLTKTLPAGIEVWNEPNLTQFWGNQKPDPVKYTAMLKAAYTKIKVADPSMTVVSAGLSPDSAYNDSNCDGVPDSGYNGTNYSGLNYLELMYKNGAQGSFDVMGWHAYAYIQPTASQMLAKNNCSGWSQMADTTPSVRSFMNQYGDSAKQTWVTEAGAATCVTGSTYPCLSETEQANLATQGSNKFASYSWHGLFFWYDLRDDYGGKSLSDWEEHFGAVRADGTVKPAYTALKTQFSP